MNQNGNNVPLLFTLGLVAVLLLAISFLVIIFLNQRKKWQISRELGILKEHQQNQLIEAAVRTEEMERHRIAEILHDEVGAILSSAKLHLLGIKENSLDQKDLALYSKGKDLLNDVIQRVRGISHNLHSNILKEFGLNEAIRHFLKKITGDTIIQTTIELDDNYQTKNPENDISLYRVIQELTNNIMKYANASMINITSVMENDMLHIHIFHNGNGLSQSEFERLRFQKEGLGLKNIQNRIILLKGKILFTQQKDGYSIDIDLPLNKKTWES